MPDYVMIIRTPTKRVPHEISFRNPCGGGLSLVGFATGVIPVDEFLPYPQQLFYARNPHLAHFLRRLARGAARGGCSVYGVLTPGDLAQHSHL